MHNVRICSSVLAAPSPKSSFPNTAGAFHGDSSWFQSSTFAAMNLKPIEVRFLISSTSFSRTDNSWSPVNWIKTISAAGFPYSYIVTIAFFSITIIFCIHNILPTNTLKIFYFYCIHFFNAAETFLSISFLAASHSSGYFPLYSAFCKVLHSFHSSQA